MSPDRLRECLALLRWSQRGLADALGMDEARVRKWARGVGNVPADIAAWLDRRADAMASDPPPQAPDARHRQEERAA